MGFIREMHLYKFKRHFEKSGQVIAVKSTAWLDCSIWMIIKMGDSFVMLSDKLHWREQKTHRLIDGNK